MKLTRQIVAAALGGLLSASAFAQGAMSIGNIKDPYGRAAPEAQAERTIRIDAGTRWVNVKRMETIRFVISQGGASKAFTWQFDALPHRSFGLDQVAPAGSLGTQQVTVYVAPNRYIDGRGR